MTAVVIDASVAIKWCVPEPHAAAARRVLRTRRGLLAPDLLWAEVGNALWKKVRQAELTRDLARDLLQDFRRFPLQTYPAKTLLGPAWDLAERLNLTVYDGLYLALAVSRACKLVTADRQFYDTATIGPFASTLVWVEQVQ